MRARGNSGEGFIGELLEATSSIFAEVVRDDLTEAEEEDFYAQYMRTLKQKTKDKKGRIARKDPNLVMKVKKVPKMPWQ